MAAIKAEITKTEKNILLWDRGEDTVGKKCHVLAPAGSNLKDDVNLFLEAERVGSLERKGTEMLEKFYYSEATVKALRGQA